MPVRAVLLAVALATPVTAGAGPTRADILIAVAGPMSTSPLTGQYATFGEQLRRAPRWRCATSTRRAASVARSSPS